MTAVSPEMLKRYGCPLCPRRFDELAAKKHHVKTKHPKKVRRG